MKAPTKRRFSCSTIVTNSVFSKKENHLYELWYMEDFWIVSSSVFREGGNMWNELITFTEKDEAIDYLESEGCIVEHIRDKDPLYEGIVEE